MLSHPHSPKTKVRPWRRALTIGVLLNVGLACTGIREDEFECEEAVSYVSECCPSFQASSVRCIYTPPSTCENNAVLPDIDIATSRCVRSRSCEQLVSQGICDRAADGHGFSEVCP
jgi:hypothetical protein